MPNQVDQNDRRVRYTVTDPSGQSEFSIDFPLDNVNYIVAYVDGVAESPNNYTVDLSALTATFDSPVAQNKIVTLEGLRELVRENGYPLRGDLRSPLLNQDMNSIFYALQEMRRDLDQTISLNKAEADGIDRTMPVITGNAGKAVLVTATGFGLSDNDFSNLDDIATDAEAAKTAAEAALDEFTDLYLGAKASDPSVDNDGDALVQGALYFNSASGVLKYYNGSSWQTVSSGTDESVKVSANDLTSGYLNGKLVAGTGVSLTENNDGGDETLTISTTVDIINDTTPQLGGPLDTNAQQVRWSKGSDVASATAVTLGTDGNYFDITGTTAIESIGSLGVGTVVKLHFDDALTLTHHATDLILPGGANITTAAGDEAEFVEYASGDWRCTGYQKASGEPIANAGNEWAYLTPINTTSGTSHSFTIPSGAKEVELMYENVSHDGANKHMVQLGDSGGIETSGYDASGAHYTSSAVVSATESTGLPVGAANTGSSGLNGVIKLSLAEASSNLWAMEGSMSGSSTILQMIGAGTKALSDELTTVRVTSFNVTNNFNGGTVHCRWR